ILPALEQRMAGWNVGAPLPAVPAPPSESPTGVFVVNKEDVNQTRVRMGHRSVTWDHPDARAIQVMNDILGGGGFTSRITKRVRSDEGLAYSAGSGYGFGRDYPRTFVAVFQSKNESVAHALTILGEEIRRIQAEPVSEEELTTSINGFVDSFPSNFSSAGAKAGTFVSDEIRGRPLDYWKTYRDKLRAVTAADVQRVAQQHLHPDKVTVLVVGKVDEVMAGDPDKPEYQLENIAGPNGIMEIALPEPATLAYPHPPRPLVGKPQVEGMGS
ncbi:MAG: insulinase family protein, partial [Acidobacteriota bacterium]